MTANAKTGWVGRQFARKEDHRLTTGRGQYFADIRVPGMLHLVFVRSAHAHARIKHIDTAAARKLPGVVAVVTGADIKEQIKPLPQPVVVPALPARYPTFWPLAVDKVKFHGEPVAAVVARDRYVAEDAAQLVEVEYETLPHVRNMEEALKPGTPVVHEGWADNEMFSLTFTGGATPETQAANDAEVDGLIKSADVVIKQRYRVHRCGVTPLETRGARDLG
jgi:carbon-monoxide dehydrogenase large subunit